MRLHGTDVIFPKNTLEHIWTIVNNSRFLILPWVRVKGPASSILARAAIQIVHDWPPHYGYKPVLFGDSRRYCPFSVEPAVALPTGFVSVNFTARTNGSRSSNRHRQENDLPIPLRANVQHAFCAQPTRHLFRSLIQNDAVNNYNCF